MPKDQTLYNIIGKDGKPTQEADNWNEVRSEQIKDYVTEKRSKSIQTVAWELKTAKNHLKRRRPKGLIHLARPTMDGTAAGPYLDL